MKSFSLALLLLCLTGCAAIGPTTSPDFPRFVNAAMPANEGQVKLFGPAEWFPNVMGFTDWMSYAQIYALNDVCVITETSLLFLQWNDSQARYVPIKRIPTTDMLVVTMESSGNARRMVVQKRDLSFDTFSFLGNSGIVIDGDRVEAATALLQNQIAVK
jgi:hypothetical protein